MGNQLDINTPITLTLGQVRGFVMEGVERTLNALGYDKYIHRAELERSTGWSRREVDKLIYTGKLTIVKRTDINSNKTWFLRTEVSLLIDQKR